MRLHKWLALIRVGYASTAGVHPLMPFGAWRVSITMSATSNCAHGLPVRNQIRYATLIV